MISVYESVLRGAPLDFTPYIDVHGHFGTWRGIGVPDALSGERLIAEMDRWGCDQVWMSASDPGYGGPMRDANETVFALARQYPDRILPYCTLSAGDPKGCLAELRRCLEYPRCIGVKMHRYEQPPYTVKSDFLQPVLELLNDGKRVYINHCFESLTDLDWALARYPDLTFINGHMAHHLMERAGRYSNFYVCTCAAMVPDELGGVVAQAGRSDKLLVGSDFNLFCLAFGPGMLAYSTMSDADQRRILGLNALRLLRRQGWWHDGLLRCTKASVALSQACE